MQSRRRFLGQTTLGILSLVGGCTPPNIQRIPQRDTAWRGNNLPRSARARLAEKNNLLGYPINMTVPPDDFFTWRKHLAEAGVGQIAYNNVGNPFASSPLPYNTHDIERQVILDFATRYGFPAGNVWGFISHSGTDSNMHGLYMGRTLLKSRTGITPKAYFTLEAHYSIQILQDLLGLESVLIDTLPDGSMNPDDLRQKLAANTDCPALVIATLGTTFKGAIDPLNRIRAVLADYPCYLHLDAALFGGYLPYTEYAAEVLRDSRASLAAPRYDSIAVSCHKFFGFPSPAGLFITTNSHFEEFQHTYSRVHNPEYIHHVPGTLTCSRDSVKPAEFGYFITDSAQQMLTQAAQGILQRTTWLLDEMQRQLPHLQAVRANALSNTVYFLRPGQSIVEKYSLATMRVKSGEQQQNCAHVVVMPHASQRVLENFLTDLKNDSVGG